MLCGALTIFFSATRSLWRSLLTPKCLIFYDNRDDPSNPMVLDGEMLTANARDPQAIGDHVKGWIEMFDKVDITRGSSYATRWRSPRPTRSAAALVECEGNRAGEWCCFPAMEVLARTKTNSCMP